MKVFASRLGERLSVTFVDDGEGWRFASWSTVTNRVPGEQPEGPDRERRFVDVATALTYFRERYCHVA